MSSEALQLLDAAERTGRLADRDEGIRLAVEALRSGPGAERAALAVAAGRALRDRWRGTYAPQDLYAALAILAESEAASAGDPGWAPVAAELARALVDLWSGLEVGSVPLPAPPGGEASPGADETREQAAADAADRAGYVARGAVAATVEGPPELRADAAHALGAALWAQGDLDGARCWLSQSVELRPSAGARWLLARTLDAQADASGDGGARAAARELLVALAAEDGAPREAFEAARYRAWAASAREDWIEAADAATAGLTLRERLRLAQREELREREWLEEAASLPSLAAYALAAAGQLEDAVARLDASLFTEIVDRLGARVARTDAGFGAIARTAEAEPLVYLVSAAPGGVALVVADGAVTASPLPDLPSGALADRMTDLYKVYGQYKRTLSPDGLARFKDALENLSGWLWSAALQPAIAALPPGATAATFVTDGVLGLLPLHAAAGAGMTALDCLQLRIAPNARALDVAREAATRGTGKALLVAVPEVAGEAPLPFAAAEVEAVAACLQRPDVLRAGEAAAHRVAASIPGRGLLHLACHGYTRFDEPSLSALVMVDAPLTLGRILELSLAETRLVVLSACESGMTEVRVPQEKASLPAGLLLAGTAGVVASLWTVDDRSTMLLMTRLHELLAAGEDPCAALRAAQLWLRDTPTARLAEWSAERAAAMSAVGAPAEQIEQMAGALAGLAGIEGVFSHPFHWAGFAYFGA